MTHSPAKPNAEPDLRSRMLDYIMRRDRLSKERAQQVLARLTVADLTMIELHLERSKPRGHSFDYDPFG